MGVLLVYKADCIFYLFSVPHCLLRNLQIVPSPAFLLLLLYPILQAGSCFFKLCYFSFVIVFSFPRAEFQLAHLLSVLFLLPLLSSPPCYEAVLQSHMTYSLLNVRDFLDSSLLIVWLFFPLPFWGAHQQCLALAQGSLLVVLGGPHVVPGITPRLFACKASTLPRPSPAISDL